MGIQINTQPQTFRSASTVMGATAGLSAVSGLTVYGDISASGTLYGTSGNVMMQNVITATGGTTYTLTNYTNNTASNYLVFLDGVKQRATTDYTISGSSIIFTSVVPSGVVIEVNVPQNISSLTGGTVNSVGLSSDGSLTVVTGSPVTTSGNIALKVGTVPLASISNTGATAGQVLTYNGSTSTWVASAAPGGSTSVTAAKAWVNFDGTKDTTGATSTANTNRLIRGSYNVTSVLRNGTGDYTITLASSMGSANYAVVASHQLSNTRGDAATNHNYYIAANPATATTINIQAAGNSSYYDMATVSVVVFA